MPLSSDRHIVDDEFKRALEKMGFKPYYRVWLRISDALNIQRRSTISRRIIIAVLLLLTGTSAGLFETLHFKNSAPKGIGKSNEAVAMIGTDHTGNKVSFLNVPPSAFQKSSYTGIFKEQKSIHDAEAVTSGFDAASEPPRSSSADLLLKIVPFHFEIIETDPVASVRKIYLKKQPQVLTPPVKWFYLGFTSSFNNTWLLDAKSIKSSTLKYESTFGISYGIQAGYVLSRHWGLEAAWLVNSWEGQNYRNVDLYGRTTDLNYDHKSIALTYSEVPLLVQYKVPMFSNLLNTPVNFNLTFGGQYGRLIAFRADNEKEDLQGNHLFRQSEIAGVVGFDYDFFINKPVFYSLGLRASYSSNIFQANAPDYLDFQAPHNFLIGVHGAINFGLNR